MAETKAGGGGKNGEVLQLSIERKRKAVREADEESRLRVLFRELGGEGKIRLNRKLPGDLQFGYLGTLDASNTVCEELEETIAGTYGGGDYKIIGREKGEDLGAVYIRIDPRQFPPRFPDQAPGQATAAAAAPALPEQLKPLLEQMERDRARMERMAEQRATDMQGFTTAIVAAMNTGANERAKAHEANTQILVAALTGKQANQAAPADPMKQLDQTLGVIEKCKALGGGAGDDNRSFTERVMEPPLVAMGTEMGKAIIEKMKGGGTPAPAPAPPPAPAAPAAAAAPAPTPPPRAAGVAPRPAGWTPITKDELETAKARLRAAKAAAKEKP